MVSSPPRKRGPRACPWLEQGLTASVLGSLDSRFRGNDVIRLPAIVLPPELARSEAGAFREAGELGPDDRRVDRGLADPGTVAAITAGDDVLAADEIGIAGDALGNQFGVLDEIGLRLDDAGDQHLAIRQFHLLEDLPFVRMTRVGSLEGETARLGQKDGLDDVSERHVAMVRTFIIAPA